MQVDLSALFSEELGNKKYKLILNARLWLHFDFFFRIWGHDCTPSIASKRGGKKHLNSIPDQFPCHHLKDCLSKDLEEWFYSFRFCLQTFRFFQTTSLSNQLRFHFSTALQSTNRGTQSGEPNTFATSQPWKGSISRGRLMEQLLGKIVLIPSCLMSVLQSSGLAVSFACHVTAYWYWVGRYLAHWMDRNVWWWERENEVGKLISSVESPGTKR